jgi:hypothetical protein
MPKERQGYEARRKVGASSVAFGGVVRIGKGFTYLPLPERHRPTTPSGTEEERCIATGWKFPRDISCRGRSGLPGREDGY